MRVVLCTYFRSVWRLTGNDPSARTPGAVTSDYIIPGRLSGKCYASMSLRGRLVHCPCLALSYVYCDRDQQPRGTESVFRCPEEVASYAAAAAVTSPSRRGQLARYTAAGRGWSAGFGRDED